HSEAGKEFVELARQAVTLDRPPFEAEAVARPDKVINPVDLGTILPPADWLLLAGGQKATVEVAALARTADQLGARAVAWYESAPRRKVAARLPLKRMSKGRIGLALARCSATREKDVLHISLVGADGQELWHKAIRVMIVPRPPQRPAFGAVSAKLRYDPPILSVRDGKYSSIDYEQGWDPALQDVVVFFPNGARWVCWRGASYCPFWAGRHNTGVSYEWAERFPTADGLGFCEPLFDNELRHGRVEIVQSSVARVHIRWAYRPGNFAHQSSGDSVVEDYYFYPDGFGTRVMTLTRAPGTVYEFQEYIVLSPQAAYPFDFLPTNIVDVLSLDGKRMSVQTPPARYDPSVSVSPVQVQADWSKMGDGPLLYRIHPNRQESLAAICYCPNLAAKPFHHFQPFHEQGIMVTPAYWGSHWPLNRGLDTGWSISDRISLGPAASSLIGWDRQNPQPIRRATVEAKDASGKASAMDRATYVWLIGMTDANDEILRHWARSFAQPPALELTGADPEAEWYAPERRALRLIVKNPIVTLGLKPAVPCVNPVFELSGAPNTLTRVVLDGKSVNRSDYAWDGSTLWLNATISHSAELKLTFRN
ncbi:MAG: hypothetical protein PHR35_22600, partial [Kiritimatiellae bacterium]|nr:hypothetical protein [Kiritimatiellia bacterium]